MAQKELIEIVLPATSSGSVYLTTGQKTITLTDEQNKISTLESTYFTGSGKVAARFKPARLFVEQIVTETYQSHTGKRPNIVVKHRKRPIGDVILCAAFNNEANLVPTIKKGDTLAELQLNWPICEQGTVYVRWAICKGIFSNTTLPIDYGPFSVQMDIEINALLIGPLM